MYIPFGHTCRSKQAVGWARGCDKKTIKRTRQTSRLDNLTNKGMGQENAQGNQLRKRAEWPDKNKRMSTEMEWVDGTAGGADRSREQVKWKRFHKYINSKHKLNCLFGISFYTMCLCLIYLSPHLFAPVVFVVFDTSTNL